jgi:hypothetical protein
MAIEIKHAHQTIQADDPAYDVGADEWNEAHTFTGVVEVASGGTGQTTEAEAVGELIQALTEDTAPDFETDFIGVYDASADTGKKVKLRTIDWRVNVLDYGAVGDGVTNDTSAITSALSAAQTANKPLFFPGGYTFLTGTITLSGDDWHVIIDHNCTVKKASDGGVQVSELFILQGDGGTIENYGVLHGNRTAQTYNDYARENALIEADEATPVSNFTYRNGGVGLITNLASSAMFFDDCGKVTIDGFIISDGQPVDTAKPSGGGSAIGIGVMVRRNTDAVLIRDGLVKESPIGAVRCSATTTTNENKILIQNVVCDWRNTDLPTTGFEEAVGYIAFENFRYFPNLTMVDCTVLAEANSIGDTALVEGVNHGSSINTRVYGGTNVNGTRRGNVSAGIETGGFVDGYHIGFVVEGCIVGCLADNTSKFHYDGIFRDCRVAMVFEENAGHSHINITTIDCGGDDGNSSATVKFSTGGAGGDLQIQAIYEDIDHNVRAVYADTGVPVHIHDSAFINNMATATSVVSISLNGDNSSVMNCRAEGQGDNGTFIAEWTGDSLRVIGNEIINYSSPWNTGSGTNALIADNITHTCTSPAGTRDATDYATGWRIPGTERLISSGSASGATLDVTWTETFEMIRLVVRLRPVDDDVECDLRVTTDGGSNWDATGYTWFGNISDSNSTFVDSSSAGTDTAITITGVPGAGDAVGNASGEFILSEIILHSPAATAVAQFMVRSTWAQADGGKAAFMGGGTRNNGQDTNGLRLLFESGNITSGSYQLFGTYG